MSPFVVGIDQGTTATKAYRLSADGDFRQLCSIEHRQIYPQPGWVEHDPRELLASVERCLESAGVVAGAGLDNQGETVIAWDADSGEPVHNAIVWQDNRTRDVTDRLKAEGAERIALERAGLPLDPYFSASKLRWILDYVPGAAALAQRGKLRLATSDAFFLDRLCGRYATDIVTASRTGLMNLATGEWDSELGWELHIPVECVAAVYERLMEAGRPHGIVNAGYRAIESLRLEKGYRAWGADIGPDHTPFEAGLDWAVKLAKGRPFLGRDALMAQRSQPLGKRLACFTADNPGVVLLGRETIYRNSERVGWLSSAGWGYTVGKNIGFGYVRNADGVDDAMLASGSYELEVATERIPCRLHLGALYDPRAERVKA
jgi:hypothetical protein